MPLYRSATTGNSWGIVKKTTTESRNTNTTLTADSTLQISITAAKTYIIRGRVFYDTPAAADFKWDFSVPGTFYIMRMKRACIVPAATAYSAIAVNQAPVTTTMTSTSGNGGYVEFDGVFIADPDTGGTLAFRWAQNSSNGSNTSVLEGSYIEYLEHISGT